MMNGTGGESEWVVYDSFFTSLFGWIWFHPNANMACSAISYLLFAFMIFACVKRGVFWRRIHDVYLILFFALVSDVLEYRMNAFFVAEMKTEGGIWNRLPTTVGACTIGYWIFYFHFTTAYVEALVASYRYITRNIGWKLNIRFVYIGLAIVLGLQAALFFETFLHGTPETVDDKNVISLVYCTRSYWLEKPELIAKIATCIVMLIAPIISWNMLFGKSKSNDKQSGVTAFTLLSSSSMLCFTYLYLWARYLGTDVPQEYEGDFAWLSVITFNLQSFRFPVLCLTAVIVVGDIRGAVVSFIPQPDEKPEKSIIPQTITNKNFIDAGIF